MRLITRIGSFAAALTLAGATAHAQCGIPDTCTANGTTRACDSVCAFPTSAGTPCNVATTDCSGDGVKVTCGSTLGANYIVGGNGADIICGRSGADTIRGGFTRSLGTDSSPSISISETSGGNSSELWFTSVANDSVEE